MRIKNLGVATEVQDPSSRSVQLFDSPREKDYKNESFLQRFRHNQVELKNKFRQYITTQKYRYPLVNRHIKTEVYSDESDEEQQVNVRSIRKEKQRLTEQLQMSMNSSKYLQKKRMDNQKTFFLLKNKYEKVTHIRQQRKEEVQKIEKTIKQISLEIRKEKLKYRRGIEESRVNLEKSRIACERQKFQQAEQTRWETEQYMRQLSHEKKQEISKNKLRCETVRENEKQVHLTISQVRRQKKEQADQLKLQKLLRQLAEKQEVKLASSRAKEQLTHRGKKENPNVRVLDLKIKQFRKSLGEKRLSPQPRIRLRLTHKLGPFSQGLQQYSTNGGFPFKSKKPSYTEQASSQT